MIRGFWNLKIRTKLLLGFSFSILLSIVLGVVGVMSLFTVDEQYTRLLDGAVQARFDMTDGAREFARLRRIINEGALYSGDNQAITQAEAEFNSTYQNLMKKLQSYRTVISGDPLLTSEAIAERMAVYDKIVSSLENDFKSLANSVFNKAKENDIKAARELIDSTSGEKTVNDINSNIDSLLTMATERVHKVSAETTQVVYRADILLFVFIGTTVLFSILIAIFIAHVISGSIRKLAQSSEKLAVGDFNVELGSNTRDEIGQLSNDLLDVKNTFESLITSIGKVSDSFSAGDTDARIDESIFRGQYKDAARKINVTNEGLISDIHESIRCMSEYANGNFDATIKRFPGKKAEIHTALDSVKSNLQSISHEINDIISGAANGKLDVSMNASKYNGGWKTMASGLNSLLEAIINPVRESIKVLEGLSNGNLNVSVSGSYKGEFEEMKKALNSTLGMLMSYIQEMSQVLGRVCQQDLTVGISREYVGEFAEMKRSINEIVKTFNLVLSEINTASTQVAAGAKQISESSMNLATGSTEQASAVQELNSTIDTIGEQTSRNAINAEKSNNLAIAAKESAAQGNEQMHEMLGSMHDINQATTKISNIIKVIDDIAFQTNILALNAAIEAARAGQSGRGFAVVAEEVRSLASRSQDAAAETASLIEETVEKVAHGSSLADRTADSLERIVKQIDEIADIANNVAQASMQQSEAIGQITIGISQIASVTQTNSATSEEQASASEELYSQSETFKSMVGKFKVK